MQVIDVKEKKNSIDNVAQRSYGPLLRELVIRDLKLKYRRSFLGYLWSLLNPLLMMIVMSLVFSYMFKSNIENFPLYLICGNTLFSFFSESTNMAMSSVINNGTLIRKVYVPKVVFPLSRVLSSFVTMSFSLAAVLLVMLIMRSHFYLTLLLSWVPLVFLLVFSFGISMLLSSLAVFFRDITHLYGVILMIWMYLTPIFYPLDPALFPPAVISVIKANPLYHYVTFFRSLVMLGQVPDIRSWLICAFYSALSVLVGWDIFRRLEKKFILYL